MEPVETPLVKSLRVSHLRAASLDTPQKMVRRSRNEVTPGPEIRQGHEQFG